MYMHLISLPHIENKIVSSIKKANIKTLFTYDARMPITI